MGESPEKESDTIASCFKGYTVTIDSTISR